MSDQPDHLQRGIYFRKGERPPVHWSLVVLAAAPEAPSKDVGDELSSLHAMWSELKAGTIRDLPGMKMPAGALEFLIGYGPHVFQLAGAPTAVPEELDNAARFRSPLAVGGGPLLPGAGIAYADDINKNIATEAIAVQFTGDTALTVNRPVVETWKALADRSSSALGIAGVFTGFQRDDARSWIDFHDGVSNLPGEDARRSAIVIPDGPFAGGTTMCFMKVAVDLKAWRAIPRERQELLVGRAKGSGCPLVAGAGGSGAAPGCPVANTDTVMTRGNQGFRDAPVAGNEALRQSHIHRSNRARSTDYASPNSLRVFRQGYEFLEPVSTPPGFRVGLNFISFQAQPSRITRMLTQSQWLGRTNFGGGDNATPDSARFLTVRAAAFYLAPPVVEGEAFPGRSLFAT